MRMNWKTAYLPLAICSMMAGPLAYAQGTPATPPAQSQPGTETAAPAKVTIQDVIKFINDAGYQVCEKQEVDPKNALPGTVESVWAGVAKDCTTYDSSQATMINAHQYATMEQRDEAIAKFKSLHIRSVRGFGTAWPVGETGALAVFGPGHNELSEALREEWHKRHPNE